MSDKQPKRQCFLCWREAAPNNRLCNHHLKEGYEVVREGEKAYELAVPLRYINSR